MNQWSSRRKKIIFFSILFTLIVLVGVPLAFLFYRAPSCSDGKINGDEGGVDCGGSCVLICAPESLPLLIKGDPRVLEIATSTYEVVAIIENTNVTGEVIQARYVFKLYDSNNTNPSKTIEGTTYIPKASTFALFEGPFNMGEKKPVRATLEWFEESMIWRKNDVNVPELQVKNIQSINASTSPRVTATLSNPSLDNVFNVELVTLVTGGSGNIIAASKTVVDKLNKGEEAPLVFSWPNPFPEAVLDIDVLPRVFPDRSFLR